MAIMDRSPSLELELKVIASCIRLPSCIPTVLNYITSEHFENPVLSRTFSVIKTRHGFGKGIDYTVIKSTVVKQLDPSNQKDAGELLEQVRYEDLDDVNVENACILLNDWLRVRKLELVANSIRDKATRGESSDTILESIDAGIKEIGQLSVISNELLTLGDVVDKDGADSIYDATKGEPGVTTPWPEYDAITGGLRRGRYYILASRPSLGKAQPLTANVLTANGFTPMGDIQIGDKLASIDGEPSTVTGIFPQGIKDVYEVEFSDGRKTECCLDHLWSVTYRDWEGPRVLTTQRLIEMLKCKRYQRRVWIERYSGKMGDDTDVDLPIEPYTLGVLLGDGCRASGVKFSKPDMELVNLVESRLPDDCTISSNHTTSTHAIIMRKKSWNRHSSVHAAMISMGLHMKYSYEKFIPKEYFSASYSQRLELLRGLMDTDGDNGSMPSYTTTSPQLADDFVFLVRSLGMICSRNSRITHYTHNGERRAGRLSYRINISANDPTILFNLSRKKYSGNPAHTRGMSLTVKSITLIGQKECQCITVSHQSQLYVTDDFIITHNSSLICNIAFHAAFRGRMVVLFSHEMDRQSIWRRICSAETGLYARDMENGELATTEKEKAEAWIAKYRDLPLYISDRSGKTPASMNAELRRFKVDHGEYPELVIVDYLQLMKSGLKGKVSEYEDVSALSKAMREGTREFNAAYLILSQLNRGIESRDDGKPMLSDLLQSGKMEADADVVTFIHRPGMHGSRNSKKKSGDGQEIPKEYTELLVEKQRNGRLGCAKLKFDGAHCRFNSWTEGEVL